MTTSARQGRVGGVITVGYDGSARAERAVRWAATEASRRSAEVRLVVCFGTARPLDPWHRPAASHLDAMWRSARDVLDAEIAAIELRHPSVRFVPIAMPGAPQDALLDLAADSDLLVIGTSGHGFLGAWRLGAVAHEALQRSPCPLVLVPGSEPATEVGRIVVGIDGSRAAHQAMCWASDEAARRDADLLVVHVWTSPPAIEGRDRARVDAALLVEATVRAARAHSCGRVDGLQPEGAPTIQLLQLARDADLVVVGAAGRDPTRAMRFGSLGHTVSARSSCPTVVVPHAGS